MYIIYRRTTVQAFSFRIVIINNFFEMLALCNGKYVDQYNVRYFIHHLQLQYSLFPFVILRMIKPLSLFPRYNSTVECDSSSPTHRQRADSLVFSITSQKHLSGRDINLLQSREDFVSKQLQTLQFKLESLQNKVQHIKTDSLLTEFQEIKQKNIAKEQPFCVTFDKSLFQNIKENINQSNKAGKIVKKQRSLSRSKIVKATHKSKVQSNESRNSLQNSMTTNKTQQLTKLRKLVNTMRESIQKRERSKSICSQRLSASKSLIKKLKRQESKNQKTISKLRKDLKKSQNIREKQKDIILRQQQEINHYRQLLRLSKPIR